MLPATFWIPVVLASALTLDVWAPWLAPRTGAWEEPPFGLSWCAGDGRFGLQLMLPLWPRFDDHAPLCARLALGLSTAGLWLRLEPYRRGATRDAARACLRGAQ